MTRLLVIQNNPYSPASLAGDILQKDGATLDVVLPHEGDPLPVADDEYDGAIILGGPQHAGDDLNYPAFQPMMNLLKEFHAKEKPLLGICLGSQLLARTFGKRVRRHIQYEWGFSPLRLTDAADKDFLLSGLSSLPRIFQWHEDTFDLPDEAVALIEGDLCLNQAFRMGRATYAFQGHFELSVETAKAWLDRWGENTGKVRYGPDQGPKELARVSAELERYIDAANEFCRTITKRWLQLAKRHS